MENWFAVSWRDGRAGGLGLLLCLARGESGLNDRWKPIERLPGIARGLGEIRCWWAKVVV